MKLLTTFLFTLCTTILFAQNDLDKMMTKSVPTCNDVARNAFNLIIKYGDRQDYDSVKVILNYWEEKCGKNDFTLKTKILLDIKDRLFTELMYDSTIIYHVTHYVNTQDPPQYSGYRNYHNYYNPNENYGTYSIGGYYAAYNAFTKKLAQKLLPLQAEGSVEKLFCSLYTDTKFDAIKEIQENPAYKDTKIKAYYDSEVAKNLIRLRDTHFSFVMGLWSPIDKAQVLGNHTALGFQVGGRYKKTTYSGSLMIRFLSTPVPYQVIYRDSLVNSTYFLGFYIGLDVDRELLRWQKNEIDLLAGIGYDGFDAIQTNSDNNNNNVRGKTIGSLNLNAGIGFKRYLKVGGYLGIQGKYNVLNYKNKGGTDLSGNAYTLNLIWGGFSNSIKDAELKRLRYR